MSDGAFFICIAVSGTLLWVALCVLIVYIVGESKENKKK